MSYFEVRFPGLVYLKVRGRSRKKAYANIRQSHATFDMQGSLAIRPWSLLGVLHSACLLPLPSGFKQASGPLSVEGNAHKYPPKQTGRAADTTTNQPTAVGTQPDDAAEAWLKQLSLHFGRQLGQGKPRRKPPSRLSQ